VLVTDEILLKRAREKNIVQFFDKIVLYHGNYVSGEIKLDLPDISLFDETFYIDADSL